VTVREFRVWDEGLLPKLLIVSGLKGKFCSETGYSGPCSVKFSWLRRKLRLLRLRTVLRPGLFVIRRRNLPETPPGCENEICDRLRDAVFGEKLHGLPGLIGGQLISTQEAPQKSIPHRIPSLDGCRAISIILVILSHLCDTPSFHSFDPYARMIYHFGPFGVKVFFVISGFLITTLLLNEERKNGRISIKMFYIRRAFRIWPVAYAFILVLAVLAWRNWITLPAHNLLYAATFLINHVQEGSWFTGHFWSLAIEEQFYLVWPLVFLAPLLRTLSYVYQPGIFDAMQQSLLFKGDAIAVGCLLALFSKELETSRMVHCLITLRGFFVIPVISVIMYITLKPFPVFYWAAGESIALLCIAASIWRVVHVRDLAFWFLNTKWLVTVGVLSYSLYVWQQLFLNPMSASVFNRVPLNLLLVCGVAAFSYHFIESPFLRLRPILAQWFQSRRRSAQVQTSTPAVSAGNSV
jgi:peptidoglycan/LPS O-acetylase OafA/YrhL